MVRSPPPPPWLLRSLLFFLLLFSARTQAPHSLLCDSRDGKALTDFSGSFVSRVPGWTPFPLRNCCRLKGVVCGVSSSPNNSSGSSTARVVELNLRNLSLAGAVNWTALGGLDKLKVLDLSQNALHGAISPALFQLRDLEAIDLSFNFFDGAIPDEFHRLKKLRRFFGYSNNFTGQLPPSISSCSMLTSLGLRNNSLTGRIEVNFTNLLLLRQLNLGDNRFVGRIPGSLFFCTELEYLDLAQNQLHGPLPWDFKNLQKLSLLSLRSNNLSDVSRAFEALSSCRNLKVLSLSQNFHGEMFPNDNIAGFQSLEFLMIANCRLLGSVPSWIRHCAGLRLLNLSSNSLDGSIPPWLGGMIKLSVVDLSNNNFAGAITESLTNLTGLKSFSSTTYMPSLDSPTGNRSADITFRSIPIPRLLDLSSNNLDGPILPGFGNLTGLMRLNLSDNNLSGSIPGELSGIRRLEFLDLSHNNLSGSIPFGLINLTFLSRFSVAYNNLEGQVPTQNQFGTFSNSSYEGNPGLCGEPILRPCGSSIIPIEPGEEPKFRIKFMPLPYGIGFLLGFIPTVVGGTYCIRRRRRRKIRRD